MTNVNELRQRIAEIEVPKSFLKSLKRDYGHQPIKKTSIGNLPNAEPSAFERRKRNFNIYRTDDYSDTIEDRFDLLDTDSIITKADRENYTDDIPKWTAGERERFVGDKPPYLGNEAGPTFGLAGGLDLTNLREKDINLTTGERTAILKQRLARIYEP